MPSLRRALSSPSVRSSPYSYPAASSPTGHATRAGGHQPRRSSGSDTSGRRVLADLDWWLVQDGQYEVAGPTGEASEDGDAAENEQVRTLGANVASEEDVPVPPTPVAATVTFAAGLVAGGYEDEIISSPLWDVSTDSSHLPTADDALPLPQFAALSIAPRTPLRRHASESSQSSVDSTPEFVPDSLFPLPTYMDIFRPAAPAYPSVFASSITSRRPAGRAPALTSRSVSYSAVEFQLSTTRLLDDRFDDIVPSPPPFFSSTMGDSDLDDLFY
ncbi:hypothetical protein C8Q80DRAFT_1270920 [Daedaleopsis nitida]|nr:hypothetical protein C8Q80DRAFT_1270920 [Daedaleopsis nitida]